MRGVNNISKNRKQNHSILTRQMTENGPLNKWLRRHVLKMFTVYHVLYIYIFIF